MMRGFGLADCVPVGDSALSEGLRRFHDATSRPAEAELRALMSAFAPHRSVATGHFWALAQERA